MELPEKQDIDTGTNAGQTSILAGEDQSTAEKSKPAPTKSASASIESIASRLALLQNDCSELQSLGLPVSILAREGKLCVILACHEHKLGFDTGTGHVLVNGVPVLKAMLESDTGREK